MTMTDFLLTDKTITAKLEKWMELIAKDSGKDITYQTGTKYLTIISDKHYKMFLMDMKGKITGCDYSGKPNPNNDCGTIDTVANYNWKDGFPTTQADREASAKRSAEYETKRQESEARKQVQTRISDTKKSMKGEW